MLGLDIAENIVKAGFVITEGPIGETIVESIIGAIVVSIEGLIVEWIVERIVVGAIVERIVVGAVVGAVVETIVEAFVGTIKIQYTIKNNKIFKLKKLVYFRNQDWTKCLDI